MKIAIHPRKGSFSDKWISYCEENDIPFKIVNCYDYDIIEQLKDCCILMWHHNHTTYRDVLCAKQLLFTLEHTGKRVFPNFKTNWHFDDKVGQKYLLESIDAPFVPTYVFYNKNDAIEWAERTEFPKVFKLRGGSGSRNVRLAKTKREALVLINKSFGRGFSPFDSIGNIRERIRRYKEGVGTFLELLNAFKRMFFLPEYSKMLKIEKGYAYFQDFIPNNNFDIRIIVVGERAFGIKRMTRKDDFRASGSGDIIYDPKEIDVECVQLAFRVNEKIGAQCISYDFVFDKDKCPLIVEISYGYSIGAYIKCPGYWDKKLNWCETNFNPESWMIEEVRKYLE